MRFLILSDTFSLESWLIDEQEPEIMPAVYQFLQFIGSSDQHFFKAIMILPGIRKTITFPNQSTIEIYPLKIPFHYLRKLLSLFYIYKLGLKELHHDKYDLVYGMSIYSIVARILGRQKKLFSVSRIFGSLIYDAIRQKKYFKLYTRFILQYLEAKYPTDLIICTEDGTQFDKALEIIKPGKKVHLLLNGIDPLLKTSLLSIPAAATGNANQKIKMLSMGRLTYWKRHDLAIKLLYILQSKYRLNNIELSILGKGEEKSKLQALADQYGIKDKVWFIDPVPHKDIHQIFSLHSIFLSLYDASNLSNSMWEASLAGRIICTRPSGKTSDYFKQNQNCIMHDHVDDIANSLAILLNDRNAGLAAEARKLVANILLSWEERFEKEFTLIELEKAIFYATHHQ